MLLLTLWNLCGLTRCSIAQLLVRHFFCCILFQAHPTNTLFFQAVYFAFEGNDIEQAKFSTTPYTMNFTLGLVNNLYNEEAWKQAKFVGPAQLAVMARDVFSFYTNIFVTIHNSPKGKIL